MRRWNFDWLLFWYWVRYPLLHLGCNRGDWKREKSDNAARLNVRGKLERTITTRLPNTRQHSMSTLNLSTRADGTGLHVWLPDGLSSEQLVFMHHLGVTPYAQRNQIIDPDLEVGVFKRNDVGPARPDNSLLFQLPTQRIHAFKRNPVATKPENKFRSGESAGCVNNLCAGYSSAVIYIGILSHRTSVQRTIYFFQLPTPHVFFFRHVGRPAVPAAKGCAKRLTSKIFAVSYCRPESEFFYNNLCAFDV